MMLIAVVVAYNKIRRLDVNQHPTPILDNVLLYICVPAFFMETLFTVIATVNLLNVVKLLDTLIMVSRYLTKKNIFWLIQVSYPYCSQSIVKVKDQPVGWAPTAV